MTKCSHPLTGVCNLLNLVGSFLQLRNWPDAGPDTELLPQNVPIIYKKSEDDTKREDAIPLVAYEMGDYGINRFNRMIGTEQLGGVGSVSGQISTSVTFTISTTNDALTDSLAYVLGVFCFVLSDTEAVSELQINSVNVSGTRKNDAGFFEATVSVNCATVVTSWKFDELDSKLREIQLVIDAE